MSPHVHLWAWVEKICFLRWKLIFEQHTLKMFNSSHLIFIFKFLHSLYGSYVSWFCFHIIYLFWRLCDPRFTRLTLQTPPKPHNCRCLYCKFVIVLDYAMLDYCINCFMRHQASRSAQSSKCRKWERTKQIQLHKSTQLDV